MSNQIFLRFFYQKYKLRILFLEYLNYNKYEFNRELSLDIVLISTKIIHLTNP